MRKGIAFSAAAALAVIAGSATPAAASDEYLEHGPDGVTITVATVNGSGCPLGTAAIALSENNDAFTITYSKYFAQVGGSSLPTDERKNCQLNLKVHVPQGFTYAVSSTDYRGYASLREGASATQLASYYFQGNKDTRAYSYPIAGPFKKNWQNSDTVNVAQLVWSPCGEQRNFNINTELRADLGTSNPSDVSYVSMDSTDGSIKTTYHYAWKVCK
ncbi:DUF4360 domain-containing protein [Actinomadura decatromicini]|uniref:DUF4360 domain-containing protein n=1 Tax=Actinomadura decatromicini TaxID=2604572 RepID=A0A5D3F866_9ACTN|nr:DUF4360 domain-containing protein [Actinomadura decatromicini]TYK44006.1 DUF4360 domain-containing protein [Actinomadura decatromicini]